VEFINTIVVRRLSMIMDKRSGMWLAVNFAATIFVSAFLLFQVQPLVSKYILPWFGGTAAVWTTCMLFFQTLLFCGYAYAHVSQKWLAPRIQVLVHLVLIAVALLSLNIVPDNKWKPTGEENPVGQILLLLAISVGLPYFVLSSTGPLIQAWFARSFPGRVPYRLYALSNIGSLLALLSYPFWFERQFEVKTQAVIWSAGFILYGALCGYAAVSVWLASGNEESSADTRLTEASPVAHVIEPQKLPEASVGTDPSKTNLPNGLRVTLWLILPFFASVGLLAVTNHVSIDVTPMPFLWVAPLSLYLLSFIVAFDHPRWYRPLAFVAFTLLMIYIVGMVYASDQSKIDVKRTGIPGEIARHTARAYNAIAKFSGGKEGSLVNVDKPQIGFLAYAGLNFAALFGICMLCHGELVRLRPEPKHLTAFYLMIAAGGALGGLFAIFVAPQIFVTYYEWNMTMVGGYLLAIALLLREIWRFSQRKHSAMVMANLIWIIPLLAGPTLAAGYLGVRDLGSYLRRPDNEDQVVQLQVRNFFGTLRIEEDKAEGYRLLYHGRITHGLQFTDPDHRFMATTYYAPESGVARAIGFYRQSDKVKNTQVGAVGLGTGTLAAFIGTSPDDPRDSICFYEINPNVVAISEPGDWFTYLRDCKARGGKYRIAMGDARLSLEREEPQHYHALVLDAFSGDAIPIHLLTKESAEIYLKHLANAKDDGEDGALIVHITNRYLDLEPVVEGLAREFNLGCAYISNGNGPDETYSSDWMILTKNKQLLAELEPYKVAPRVERDPPEEPREPILWTDGKNNLFDVLK
jgi:hypothetical protein